MKELNRTDRLTIATILFAVVLLIGIITLKRPDIPYTHSIDETLNLVLTSNETISSDELYAVVLNNDPDFFLIDVRTPLEFEKSHIDHAINIPVHDILNKENTETISDQVNKSKVVLLYGDDQLEANGAWLMLKQTGIDNVKVMQGGYQLYKENQVPGKNTGILKDFNTEVPHYNFKETFKSFGIKGSDQKTDPSQPVNIIKKEKKSAAEGGC